LDYEITVGQREDLLACDCGPTKSLHG